MSVEFNNEDKFEKLERVEKKSKSTFAKWLVSIKLAKNDSQGEKLSFFLIFLILILASVIFSLGIGNNKIIDLEESGSEYLE